VHSGKPFAVLSPCSQGLEIITYVTRGAAGDIIELKGALIRGLSNEKDIASIRSPLGKHAIFSSRKWLGSAAIAVEKR
jgi:hypothetical protein